MTVHRMVESKMPVKKQLNSVKKKYSGNSVHLRICGHVLSISKHPSHDTSGILTGLGKSVHTGTYQYVLVQHGTRQYENLTVVRTGMYWYIPVRTLKKTSCFLTHPERVRRDKIKAVQLLCMRYNVAKLNFKTTQV